MKETIATELLAIGAVTLRPEDPYTWTSGIRSPMYCDNRLTLSYPLIRSHIADAFCDILQSTYPAVECIAGTATAGISHAALIADRLGLPMVYVRTSAKGHGKQNLIEGRLLRGQRTVVVEDTISTGGSALAAVAALRAQQVEVPLTLAIFDYGFAESKRAFVDAGVLLRTLTDFPALVDAGVRQGLISETDVARLLSFVQDPKAYA
ncbi:MAG: orotate phosphoribosyltransferase [Firmicutes bacterium]|nr:orotate phosphoribosyltransferase [Bacillota bacterium]